MGQGPVHVGHDVVAERQGDVGEHIDDESDEQLVILETAAVAERFEDLKELIDHQLTVRMWLELHGGFPLGLGVQFR